MKLSTSIYCNEKYFIHSKERERERVKEDLTRRIVQRFVFLMFCVNVYKTRLRSVQTELR